MNAETWAALPESTQRTIRWLVEQGVEGFTGEIALHLLNGSVEEIRPTPVLRPKDLAEKGLTGRERCA